METEVTQILSTKEEPMFISSNIWSDVKKSEWLSHNLSIHQELLQ